MIETFLNNRFITLYFLPLVTGLFTVLSFQPFNFSFINFFILPFLFYLIVYINKKSRSVYRKKPYKKNLFIFGTCFGFGFYLSGIHWITNSLTFDENFKILIPFGLILIPLALSLFFSVVIVIIGPYLNFNLHSVLLFITGLSLSDYIRSKIFTGFPWNLWGYSFSWSDEIIQILNVLGLFSFNLIILTLFMIPATIFTNLSFNKKFFSICLIPLFFFLAYIFGNHAINQNQKFIETTDERFYIKVISPNFELKYGLSKDEIYERAEKLIKYSEPKGNIKTLFVWPEGVFSGYNYEDILFLKDIFSKYFNSDHSILFGVNRFDETKKGIYNSLIIVNSKLEIIKEYKKQKLVPFGEFLPFESFFHNFGLKKITEGHGSFLKGKKQENLEIDKLNILPLICYEVIFTNLVQKSSKNTNLIINISEDGWFGNSIGPYQHFSKAIFRAVEKNTYLIRSANKGISAIINNKGQVVKKLSNNERGHIEFNVPLIKSKNKNKNDLIFFLLLITYILFFKFNINKNEKK